MVKRTNRNQLKQMDSGIIDKIILESYGDGLLYKYVVNGYIFQEDRIFKNDPEARRKCEKNYQYEPVKSIICKKDSNTSVM